MDPARKIAPEEVYIFPHIQLPAKVIESSHFREPPVDNWRPKRAIHGLRAEVDFRFFTWIGGRLVAAVAAVIVAVEIEDDNARVSLQQPLKQRTHLGIEIVVSRERA